MQTYSYNISSGKCKFDRDINKSKYGYEINIKIGHGLSNIQYNIFLQDVKNEHKVPVDMRIGVHSGYMLSGIIGRHDIQIFVHSLYTCYPFQSLQF